MKKKVLISVITLLLIVGGVFVVRGFTQTGVTALDDSFTREFLDEEVEVGEGFYLFEARNGQYTMWFPENYYIANDRFAYESSNVFEVFNVGSGKEISEAFNRTLQVDYRGRDDQNLEDVQEEFIRLLASSSYQDEFKEYNLEEQIIQYGYSHITAGGHNIEVKNPNELAPNTFFGIASKKDGSEFVMIQYDILCDEKQPCDVNANEEIEFFESLIEHVNFK
ncbi:hypothetical protein [Alkalicoccobacillus porphyridii]|uniref:Uncharacterized protein n=1 Tax=Alkalicoccobacillus porphyridii TaxID=2597270 RepID=A0A554A4B5_9BACI|nr:hypothetical protein [Alkalicoccobacillus porphyridii]TSB48528.1 hypothetical protein FN960_02960 [Alkalicoccobacillus porphyridii]